MTTKNERLELRVDTPFLKKVDEWRRNQPDLPSRASAVRQLTEIGLAADKKEGKRR